MRSTRELVKRWIDRAGVRQVEAKADIRDAVLAEFTKQLDGKLANLQVDEMLVAHFRLDIVGINGSIRGGSGAQRNMPEYRAWRAAVYERDGYRCQECDRLGGVLQAHHIRSWAQYPELRFDVDNGITLCKDCHVSKHPHLKLLKREVS